MYLKFFAAPNANLVDKAMIEFDGLRLRGMLSSLPMAIQMMAEMYKTLELDEEADRLYVNDMIHLAEVMIEIIDDVYGNKNVQVIAAYDSGVHRSMMQAADALAMLQHIKDVKIAKIHAEAGPHFGSATGFQTTNYLDNAVAIRKIAQGES